MKMKLNISGAGISRFFANNVEKLILAVTFAVLLAFIYGAITAKPLDGDTPSKIKSESKQAVARVNEVPWPPPDQPGLTPTSFAASMEKNVQDVQIARLEHGHDWDPRLFKELVKRADPEIYPVQELRVASGCGVVPYTSTVAAATHNPAGMGVPVPSGPSPNELGALPGIPYMGMTEGPVPQRIANPSQSNLPGVRVSGQSVEPRAKFYAILTGVVPYEKQAQEYKRRFEYAEKDPAIAARAEDLNMPQYRFCLVERAEVKDSNDANLKWAPVDVRAAYDDLQKWAQAQGRGDIVDQAYVLWQTFASPDQPFSLITWPLPPLLLRDWGLEAAHPKVPLFKPYSEVTQPSEIEQPLNPFDANAAAGNAARAGLAPPRQTHPMETPVYVVRPMMRGGYLGGMNASETGVNQGPSVPYLLLRYIDLTAEPGKIYRYRVQLVLRNPNHNVHPQYLEKADSAKVDRRSSAWSEPTPPVRIPSEARILASSVGAPRSALTEPVARAGILALLKEPVVEVLKDVELSLGGVANFRVDKIEKVIDMATDQFRDVGPVTLNAEDSLLLDVRNDDPLGLNIKSKAPAELLLMDASGRLRVTNSASDSLVAKDYKQRTEIPAVAPVDGEMAPGASALRGVPPNSSPSPSPRGKK